MTENKPLLSIDTNINQKNSNIPYHRQISPTERKFIKNVGWSEWEDVEKLSINRGEIITPDEDETTKWFSWRTLWAYVGPGWLMSIAYVDPGNLESDLQAGAYVGYKLVWVLFFSTMLGFFLQVLAARLGVVTGKSLAEMCRLVYPRSTAMTLWIMTEIAIIGSDIQEVLGSSIAFQILFGLPLWVGCLLTGIDTFTFLMLHKFGIRKLEAFFITLIAIMLVCFFVNFKLGGIETIKLLKGFIPEVDSRSSTQAVGILGAVIMPHNIFLHSSLVQSRAIDRTKDRKIYEANKYFSIEAGFALLISFFINLAVLGVFAEGFYSSDCINTSTDNLACMPLDGNNVDLINKSDNIYCHLNNHKQGVCQQIGLAEAGTALRGLLGNYGEIVWAIGLLAAGQSSTMTGTYAGQFVMEGFLHLTISPWKRVLITRCVALIPALTVAVWSQNHPGTSDYMDELLNILQSIQLPFALLLCHMFYKFVIING